jgi:hypothetical protein
VFAGSNESYNEVWWFYCSQGSKSVDKYIIYNYLERVWSYGTMSRTAWLDSGLRQFPMAAYPTGNKILFHEANVDDVSGLTPVPIEAYIQSSDFDIADGDGFMLSRSIIQDIGFSGSTANNPAVDMQIRTRNVPGSALTNNPSDSKIVVETSVDQFTNQVFMRARARHMAFKIRSEALGVQWQLGAPRLDAREDGRR